MADRPQGVPPSSSSGQAGGIPRLSEAEVAERLTRLEGLLDQLERVPGPGTDLALEAVATLTAIYGEALSRIMTVLGALQESLPNAQPGGLPDVTAELVADDLLGHLLILHGLSPVPAGQRIAAALAEIRPLVQAQGSDVRLAGVDGVGGVGGVDGVGGVARVELLGQGKCCSATPATPATLREAIEAAILGAAPELASVEIEQVEVAAAQPEPTLIPVDAILRSRRVSPGADGPAPTGSIAQTTTIEAVESANHPNPAGRPM
jgi:Fe-S cluster biogenesis protein NfuA